MDINEAALQLAKIQILKSQVEHLQREAKDTQNWEAYATDCNAKAQELIKMLEINSLFQ